VLAGIVFADRSRAGRALGRPFEKVTRALGGLRTRLDETGDADDADWAFDDEYDGPVDGDDGDDDGDDGDDFDDSSVLDQRVLAAFQQDPVLASRAIEIEEPDAGVIRLTGRVHAERDIAHAVTIARGVPGVEHVEHKLRLRRGRNGHSGSESPV
jgi:hypothetical protein